MPSKRSLASLALVAASAVVLSGCAASEATPATPAAESAASVQVEDNTGSHTIALPATSIVALDNRTFQTLDEWGIQLSAAAVALMPDSISYTQDDTIVDIGNHREPDLEAIVAVEPDLIISGQRFSDRDGDLAALAPDATILQLEPREGEPFDDELRRQVTVLGEVFGKQDEAAQLVADFDAAIERAAAAYDGAPVMAVTTSGGEIGYLAPGVGRTLGPVFDILDLSPALEVEGASDDHQGDDISVEAIAASNPAWILVMDRDAAVAADDPSFAPAADILEGSEALTGVTAVREGQLVYMPADTYTNESIQTYTEFFEAFAHALEASS